MSYKHPNQQTSPTPSNWLDMLNSNSVCYEDQNNGLHTNNNNNELNADSSKIFGGDISMFDFADINMLMDANVNANFNIESGFDNDKLLDDLNGSLEPIPQSFFLSKELSSQFVNLKSTTENITNELSEHSPSNQKMIKDLKDTVYNNIHFQKQFVENLDSFVSPNGKKVGKRLSSDGKYIVNDNTPEGYKFPSEVKNKTQSKSGAGSPLRNKQKSYSVLNKYINVSDDDEDEAEVEDIDNVNNLKFNFETSPIRQQGNQTNYYNNAGTSPVASANYIQQDSPIRQNNVDKGTLKANNNNLSFFDVPQLQFNDNMQQYDLYQKPFYQAHPQYSQYGHMPHVENRQQSKHSQEQREYNSVSQNQYNTYDYPTYEQNNYNNTNTNIYHNNHMVNNNNSMINANTTAVSLGSSIKSQNNQRLKSYNSVGTSQSTILEEPSPYQQQLPSFDCNQHLYQRILSSSNSHTSSVQKKTIGLGLNVKTIKEEQELALSDALLSNGINDRVNSTFEIGVDVGNFDSPVSKHPTKKLSKFETPKLQQVPFFSSNQSDNHENLPTVASNGATSCQYIKIQSPSQEVPLIGMINRSPKGVRKKSTLPPGTIDQHIAELSDKTFICLFNDCQRKFPRRYNIRAHVQTHLQDKPHGCDICGNSFVRNHDLVRHKKTHMDKKFGCDSCGKMFLTEKLLGNHKESQKCTIIEQQMSLNDSVDNDVESALGKKKKVKSAMEIGTQVISKSGRVTKPVSPKKQQQQLQQHQHHDKTENALEFKNTMATVNNINKVVKKDTYHFNAVKF
ncbi:hypothetical protein QEN19_001882 [Hanseniaspora menglaensis]